MDLGTVLRERRRKTGMSLSELGIRSGLSISHLRRIEQGKSFPSACSLLRIARQLGLDELELHLVIRELLLEELTNARQTAVTVVQALSWYSEEITTAA